MKLQRIYSCITGVFIAVGLAASQAGAGGGIPGACDFALEFKALRGGSPTVSAPGTKSITAKALISKGSAPSGTTIVVTLTIEALVGQPETVVDTQISPGITLGVGKGGQGDKLLMVLESGDCVDSGDPMKFRATFTGQEPDGPDTCTVTRSITKTCK